jgi:hypothetical protein
MRDHLINGSFLIRSNYLSLKFDFGYGRIEESLITLKEPIINYFYVKPYYDDDFNAPLFNSNISIRFNLTRTKINPYLNASIGIENYKRYYDFHGAKPENKNLMLSNIGAGLQIKIKNSWLIESEFNYGKISQAPGADNKEFTIHCCSIGLDVFIIIKNRMTYLK